MTGTELSRPATHRPNSPTERRAILQAPPAKKACGCGGRPRFPDTGWISGRRRRHRDPCSRHVAPAALPPAPASGRSAGLLSCRVRTSSCARHSIWHAEKLAETARPPFDRRKSGLRHHVPPVSAARDDRRFPSHCINRLRCMERVAGHKGSPADGPAGIGRLWSCPTFRPCAETFPTLGG